MVRRPPRSTRTDTLFPYPTLFRSREGLRYSLFSATVVVSDSEQPDRDTLGKQEPLRRLPQSIAVRLFAVGDRSEEHTSELQSLMSISYAAFCLKTKTK